MRFALYQALSPTASEWHDPSRILRRPMTRWRRSSVHLILLLLVGIPFLFLRLGFPFLDPDEGLYASIAREMLTRGDWLVPRVDGIPYLEKPPLYFWLTAGTMAVVGSSEWVVRLWSALSALGSVLLTWRIGRRLYGSVAGLAAGNRPRLDRRLRPVRPARGDRHALHLLGQGC